MYTSNGEDKKEGEYQPCCWLGDNSPALTEQMYTKARGAAECMFGDYIEVSHKVYNFDNTELEVFKGSISKSYILDFYMAWKANGE